MRAGAGTHRQHQHHLGPPGSFHPVLLPPLVRFSSGSLLLLLLLAATTLLLFCIAPSLSVRLGPFFSLRQLHSFCSSSCPFLVHLVPGFLDQILFLLLPSLQLSVLVLDGHRIACFLSSDSSFMTRTNFLVFLCRGSSPKQSLFIALSSYHLSASPSSSTCLFLVPSHFTWGSSCPPIRLLTYCLQVTFSDSFVTALKRQVLAEALCRPSSVFQSPSENESTR